MGCRHSANVVCVQPPEWLTNCPRHHEHLAANAAKGGFGYDVSSLKDRGKVSSEYDDSSDKQSGAGEYQDPRQTKHATEQKIRNCLICRAPFPSAWAGERICRRCKATSGWRSGSLT